MVCCCICSSSNTEIRSLHRFFSVGALFGRLCKNILCDFTAPDESFYKRKKLFYSTILLFIDVLHMLIWIFLCVIQHVHVPFYFKVFITLTTISSLFTTVSTKSWHVWGTSDDIFMFFASISAAFKTKKIIVVHSPEQHIYIEDIFIVKWEINSLPHKYPTVHTVLLQSSRII